MLLNWTITQPSLAPRPSHRPNPMLNVTFEFSRDLLLLLLFAYDDDYATAVAASAQAPSLFRGGKKLGQRPKNNFSFLLPPLFRDRQT